MASKTGTSKGSPKVLFIDIETTPNLAHVWSLWKQNVGLNQLLEPTEMLCFAAKWQGGKRVHFFSQHKDGQEAMVEKAWGLLDEADVVVHYNGKRFDVPHLNREFLLAGLEPPSPYQQVDLLDTVKKRFRFPSMKLAYVSEALGLGGKVKHEGHELWLKCMAGDRQAWSRMKAYNVQDVILLEDLYGRLGAWVYGHPTTPLFEEDPSGSLKCPFCGSEEVQRRGYAYTKVSRYRRYHCQDCGKWSRSGTRDAGVALREVST